MLPVESSARGLSQGSTQSLRLLGLCGSCRLPVCPALSCSVWLCPALSGSVRLCPALSGPVRPCPALSGPVRLCPRALAERDLENTGADPPGFPPGPAPRPRGSFLETTLGDFFSPRDFPWGFHARTSGQDLPPELLLGNSTPGNSQGVP